MQPLRIALVQLASGSDADANLAKIENLLRDVEAADLIALPEVFAGRGTAEYYRAAAEPLAGPLMRRLQDLARTRGAYLLAGSVIEQSGDAVYNTSVLLDRSGATLGSYRKMHLFEARLEDGTVIRESDAYAPGRDPLSVDIEGWCAGMAVCYDLRFPELFRHYSGTGAQLLFLPSDFTQRTGRDHWEVLLRARAIENQCFIVAPNQCGENPATGVTSYGHSMAVGPWGEILCEAAAGETVVTTTLDPGLLQATRARVPALRHRIL